MGCDCETCIAKYLLSLFNFLFFIIGTTVLGVGIWLAADKSSFIALLKMVENEQLEHFTQPAVIEQLAYILIVIGSIMFFLSFLGYCGAIRESQCLLTTYGIFLLIILVLEIAAGGLAAAYKDRAKLETKNYLQSTITKYYSSNDNQNADAVTLMWNILMSEMSCCGVDDYKDFNLSDKWVQTKGNRIIPESCCVLSGPFEPRDKNCPYSPSEANSFYKTGCYNALIDWILLHRNIVISVGIGLAVFQLFAIFLAFCLCKSIDKYRGMRL
uniref:Tetraspanin n=1 Tax=Corethrella appendiculata TaxID=1370023 RepID=U5EXB2_9DIPT